MRITFDKAKDAINQTKHGVSLAMAGTLEWDAALVWKDQRFDYGEARYVALVPLGRRLFFIAFTERGSTRRIISLRKANRREISRYETEIDSPND